MCSHILIDFDFGQISISSTYFTINNKKEIIMDFFESNTLKIQVMGYSTFHNLGLLGVIMI